jgi:hypothetical protein
MVNTGVKSLSYKEKFPEFKIGNYFIGCCEDLREYFMRELNIRPDTFPFGKDVRELLKL